MGEQWRAPGAARRAVLRKVLAAPVAAVLLGSGSRLRAGALEPTPACDEGGAPTPASTAGPYFTPGSPERRSLVEPGMAGTAIVLAGRVLSTRCRPVAQALVDLWHADDRGAYDNVGYRLRGHQFTDAEGRYRFETIVPGIYRGRTRHYHVKVQAPGGRVLTTQLYFPGEAENDRDGIFRPDLLLALADGAGRFDFVLDA